MNSEWFGKNETIPILFWRSLGDSDWHDRCTPRRRSTCQNLVFFRPFGYYMGPVFWGGTKSPHRCLPDTTRAPHATPCRRQAPPPPPHKRWWRSHHHPRQRSGATGLARRRCRGRNASKCSRCSKRSEGAPASTSRRQATASRWLLQQARNARATRA